jgi:hypothetical protein
MLISEHCGEGYSCDREREAYERVPITSNERTNLEAIRPYIVDSVSVMLKAIPVYDQMAINAHV